MSGSTNNQKSTGPNRLKARSMMLLAAALIASGAGLAAVGKTETEVIAPATPDVCPNPAPWWCDRSGEDDKCRDGDMAYRGCRDIRVMF